MRTLYVSFFHVWPPQSGWAIRLANTVEALTELGPVDYVCLDRSDRPRDPVPEGVRLIELPEGPPRSARQWIPEWLRGDLPRRVLQRDFESAARQLPDVLDGPYDATVVPYIHAWPSIAEYLPTPIVLDLADLVDVALESRREAGFAGQSDSFLGRCRERVVWEAVTLADRVDQPRYVKLQQSAARACARVLVCSGLDVERAGIPNAVEIPNGYERTQDPEQSTDVADPSAPVFVFVGLYTYGPNVDGVRWFITEILPRIRRELPGARFRVIGSPVERFDDLANEPGVELVGWVPEVAPELAAADAVVVPLRIGSGTRLKVVEAMANRLPIISTAIGCEGIDVADEQQLLVADNPAEFAAAATRVILDDDLRRSIVDAAEQRYLEKYQWSTIRDQIKAEVRAVV